MPFNLKFVDEEQQSQGRDPGKAVSASRNFKEDNVIDHKPSTHRIVKISKGYT